MVYVLSVRSLPAATSQLLSYRFYYVSMLMV